MVKLLADLHGGAVAVESAVGEGSRFTVWIPVRTAQDVEPVSIKTPSTSTYAVPAGARTALVVESNYESAALIRVQLEAEGFRVLHAPSAGEALSVAGRESLALVTLDIMMSDADGWLFLKQLKGIPLMKHVPVVIISILADRTKGFAMGAAAVMQSPVSRQELYDSLVELGLLPVSSERAIRVLIVDDDPKSVELIEMHIRDLASQVFRAYGGREAIEIAERELPDLILLDLMMPEVNGFDVVDILNKNPATARIPLIVVTSSELTVEERGRLNGGVTAVMGKAGFDGKRFVSEVRRAMTGRLAAV
jgi:CheY-like chemotaxis protein